MENVEKHAPVKIKQIPVYIDVDEIVKKFAPNQLNRITSKYYNIPIDDNGFIQIPQDTTEISLTATNKDGTDGTQFWLTTLKTDSNGPIIDGTRHNPMGKNAPANVLTLQLTPNPKIGDTQSFTIHCYFITNVKGLNQVYHCSLDPKLRISQGGG